MGMRIQISTGEGEIFLVLGFVVKLSSIFATMANVLHTPELSDSYICFSHSYLPIPISIAIPICL